MDLNDNIPEEFVDIVVQEFAYDPIRPSSAEDRFLYNRRTLETISGSVQLQNIGNNLVHQTRCH